MKNYLIFLFLCYLSIFSFKLLAQTTYLDPNFNVQAKVFAYKMSTAPSIDGDTVDWSGIPWTEVNWEDRDFNNDNLIDPMENRLDFRAFFKVGWVDGSNEIYFLVKTYDDYAWVNDSTMGYGQMDHFPINLDPYDGGSANEPSSNTTAFDMNFSYPLTSTYGYDGPNPQYENHAAWKMYPATATFPLTEIVAEIAIKLPLKLTNNYQMGYDLLFDDREPMDSTYYQSPASPIIWPQLWCAVSNTRLGPDDWWQNIYDWGQIQCISPTIHTVISGQSIQSAINQAKQGDIINIGPGTYKENLIINTPNIRIVGTMANGDTTKLLPADPSKPAITITGGDSAYYVLIKNISIDGKYDSNGNTKYASAGISVGSAEAMIYHNFVNNFNVDFEITGGDSMTNAAACVIQDNTFEKGIITGLNRPFTVFKYNKVFNISSGFAISAEGLPANNTIDIAYNKIYNIKGDGGIVFSGAGVFTIHGNYIYNDNSLKSLNINGNYGILGKGKDASTSYIYNNTIVNWKDAGVQFNAPSTFNSENNIIADCGEDYDLRNNPSVTINYSLSWDNGANNDKNYIDSSGAYSSWQLGANNLVKDPQFIDASANNYEIASTSPAVDAGALRPFGFKEFFYGQTIDIGAFETGLPIQVTTNVKNNKNVSLNNFQLFQNYPNPFNPTTTIRFNLRQSGLVTLKVYNLLGQEVKTLLNDDLKAGDHEVKFDATNYSSGVYFYTIKAGNFISTKKMILLK